MKTRSRARRSRQQPSAPLTLVLEHDIVQSKERVKKPRIRLSVGPSRPEKHGIEDNPNRGKSRQNSAPAAAPSKVKSAQVRPQQSNARVPAEN
jgi:hypothetical protein